MANNSNAILAGEAYVRYYAKNDEFKRGNREAEQDFNATSERIRRKQEQDNARADYRMRQHLDRLKGQRQKSDKDEEESLARKNFRMYQQLQRQQKTRENADHAAYIQQVKFNSKILELQQAKSKKEEDQAYADYLKMVKFNSRVLELQQARQKKEEDRSHAAYIQQVKFNSKILELQQAKSKKEEDQAYADYLRMVKFNSRVLELQQANDNKKFKQAKRSDDELLRLQQESQDVQERSLNAYYDRQERKRRARIQREKKDRQDAARDAARELQRELDRENAMRNLAVGGVVLGDRISSMGRRGLSGLLGTVREYAGVEAAILSARVNLAGNGGGLSSDMRMLQRSAYDIGVKTEYDAKEVAQMMERMSISRLSADQIAKYSTPVINVASVFSNGLHGKMNPSVASRAVMEMMNAMEYSVDRIPEIADKLAVAGRRADVTLENLADAFRYAGGSAIEAGMNFDQILAALIVLDKRGLKGEMGGTALRGITASVLDPTEEAQKEYAAYGINLPRKGKLNLESLIRQFERKIGHLSPVEQAAVIAKAFPNRQMTGVQMLVGAADQMAMESAALAGSAGMGDRYASSKRQGVGFSLDVVHSAWQSAKANLGETYKDETNWAARKLAGAIESGGEFLQENPGVGKAVAYGAGGATAIGTIGGGASSLMGAYYGMKLMNGMLAKVGMSIGGLTASVTNLGVSAVAGAGKLAAAGVSAAAWPAAVAAGVAAVGVALDQAFNKGRVTKWYSAGFNDVAAYFDGRWDQSDSASYEGENVVTREQFTPKTNTFLRNDRGEIIGELDAKTGERRMFEIRESKTATKYKRYPIIDGKMVDPFTGEEVNQKDGRNLRDGQYLWDRISAGMDLKDRMGSSITGAIASGVKAGRDWLGVGQAYARQNYDAEWKTKESDRSPENPENRKAWMEFAKANPIVPGFEQESERSRADQWYSFLSNFRMQQLLKKGQPTAERVLNNLGDYELRSQTGQNYLIELLTQKKKPADGQTIDDKLLAEAQKTNRILEGKDMIGHKLGGGR